MKILDRLPIMTADTPIYIGNEMVRLRESQIIVWMSVSSMTQPALPGNAVQFPVILDTGHSHHFAILERHLTEWIGIRSTALPRLGNVRHFGKPIPCFGAKLWLHSNVPGSQTRTVRQTRITADSGIAVFPDAGNHPRLPLLGMRALMSNRLHLAIDAERNQVTLRSPDFRTQLLRWLS